MKWSFLIVAASAWTWGNAWGADAGTTSANFLKLGIGPRAIGMGEAQVGLADDVYSTYWNPAGLAQLSVPEAGFMYSQYLQDISEQYLAYAHPTESAGTFAGSLNYLGVGKFDGYDAAGQPAGSVDANDLALAASYAHTLWSDPRMGAQLAAGGSGKFIREKLDTVSAGAYAADAGLLFKPGLKWGDLWSGWSVGVTARNLGTSMKYDSESFALPRSLDAGVAWSGRLWEELATFTADGRQPNDGPRTYGFGAELWTLKTFVLRAGYTDRSDLGNGFRVGAGIRFRTLQIDYAYAGGGDLGTIQRIGLTLRLARPKPDRLVLAQSAYLKGMKDYREQRYTEALVEFNKVLEIDPSHPQALDMMRKTYDQLKAKIPDAR